MEKHEDQIEFYTCPICGAGEGNDIDGVSEHNCPMEEQYVKDMTTPPEEQNTPLELREAFKNEKWEHWSSQNSRFIRIPDSLRDAIADYWLARISEQRTALIEGVDALYPSTRDCGRCNNCETCTSTCELIIQANGYSYALNDVKKLLETPNT